MYWRMLLVCTLMLLVCTGMLHVYTRMLLACIRMLLVCTRVLLVCTRMLHVCYSYFLVCYLYVLVCCTYVLVCYSYVLACYSYVLVWCFGHNPDVLCTLSLAFVSFVLRSFGCSLFGRLFEFNLAKFNCNGNEYNGCVSVRYNSLLVSFSVVYKKVTKQQHEKATFCEREQYEDDF